MNDQAQEHTTDVGDTIEVYVNDDDAGRMNLIHLGIMEDFYASISLNSQDALWLACALMKSIAVVNQYEKNRMMEEEQKKIAWEYEKTHGFPKAKNEREGIFRKLEELKSQEKAYLDHLNEVIC